MSVKSNALSSRIYLTAGRRSKGLLILLQALSIWRERQTLRELDDHLLQDLGLTRTDVEMETKRPVWDAPNRWLR
ncbi:MAG: DUF1127 domain-containing protein [Pseudomonadota bacterium]